jgi:hypothetical protein
MRIWIAETHKLRNGDGMGREAPNCGVRNAESRRAAVRDAQQGDRDGRAPRSKARLTATFFIFFRQIAYRGLGASRCLC